MAVVVTEIQYLGTVRHYWTTLTMLIVCTLRLLVEWHGGSSALIPQLSCVYG